LSVKIQQYYIFKFNTERLKHENYNIKITPHQGRKNGEVVSIGDSQMLSSLRKVKGQDLSKEEIDHLFDRKREIKTSISTPNSILELRKLENFIDSILFIKEIVAIVVDNVKHYEHIINNGLFINNKKYVRLMCSSGQMRRNTVLFVDEKFEKSLKEVLNNGRKEIPLNPSKFNAYFALSSSTSLEVSKPYFTVVPDLIIKRKEIVDFIIEEQNGDDIIETGEKELEFNIFDGQGVISPRQAELWAKDLGLNHMPSAFVVRSNFIKGLLVVIDFVQYSDEIGEHYITDVYGNKVNIRDMDVILTESQFKLWQAYDSIADYEYKSLENGMKWWVSRYSPKQEQTYTYSNYQFLQALDLNEEKVDQMCEKTLQHFENILKNDISYTLLYLLGNACSIEEVQEGFFDRLNDVITKALLYNNDLIDDPYVQKHIARRLNRKIKDSYIGKLPISGFYTFMISDPYAFLEYIFHRPVVGLLNRGEHYCKVWEGKGVEEVVAMRAPLTWRSEPDPLKVVSNKAIKKWYRYVDSGVVMNIHGCDCAILGGADFDGDIVCLTDEKVIVDSVFGGNPIFYETQKASKEQIVEENLYKYDMLGFNPKIGFLTNCSTTMYAMLPMFDEESKEHKEIIRRLKQCRKEQGSIIDSAKGLIVRPIPEHWTKWIHVDESKMDQEEVDRANLSNSVLVDKRPMFMVFLYNNYWKDHKKYNYNYNLYSIANFGVELEKLLEKDDENLSQEERDFITKYNRYNPFLDTDCVVNNISRKMKNSVKEVVSSFAKMPMGDLAKILIDSEIPFDKEKLKKLYNLFKRYKGEKRNLFKIRDASGEQIYKTLEQYNKAIRKEAYSGISSDIRELANLAVIICYEMHPKDNKSFVWNVFGEGLVLNVKKNRQEQIFVPVSDKKGEIEYLGNSYSMAELVLEDHSYENKVVYYPD
jgi:hypothetical protein